MEQLLFRKYIGNDDKEIYANLLESGNGDKWINISCSQWTYDLGVLLQPWIKTKVLIHVNQVNIWLKQLFVCHIFSRICFIFSVKFGFSFSDFSTNFFLLFWLFSFWSFLVTLRLWNLGAILFVLLMQFYVRILSKVKVESKVKRWRVSFYEK